MCSKFVFECFTDSYEGEHQIQIQMNVFQFVIVIDKKRYIAKSLWI